MKKHENRIFIVGATEIACQLADLISKEHYDGRVVAIIDDDNKSIGTVYRGIPVLGPIANMVSILQHTYADEAIIILNDSNLCDLKQIYEILKKANFQKIRIFPQNFLKQTDALGGLLHTRDIDPQDLLLRDPVDVDLRNALGYVRNKRVVVTGAGGTIGGELCRQLLYGNAQRIYLLGHGENSIYQIYKELVQLQKKGIGTNIAIVPVIADLLDVDHIHFLLNRLNADIIYHCAAHKHVPMIEANPIEGIKNNFFGSVNLLEAAIAAKVERFINISTDKAVSPSSVYGISKRLVEEYVRYKRKEGYNCKVVRFGNVLGSRGSFIPLFKEQIAEGGPVTVTHPDMKRYFMTITEAVSLVLWASGHDDPEGFYLLDMSDPIKIVDIAQTLISFYACENSIQIVFTGLRPGEKIDEKLKEKNEILEESEQAKVWRLSSPHFLAVDEIRQQLQKICFKSEGQEKLYRNKRELRKILKQFFPNLEMTDVSEY